MGEIDFLPILRHHKVVDTDYNKKTQQCGERAWKLKLEG